MICESCKEDNPDDCWGLTKDKTWCDSQHVARGANIDPQQCKHLALEAPTRVCPSCSRPVPLTMTKEQAMYLFTDFQYEFINAKNMEEQDQILSGYAERILNDRPTRSVEDAKASFSEM